MNVSYIYALYIRETQAKDQTELHCCTL